MVTYGDMMGLLLTFFILIVSFSSIQQTKFEKAMGSLKKALGVMPLNTGMQGQMILMRGQPAEEMEEKMMEKVAKMQEGLEAQGLQEAVKITMTEKGVHIVISDPILFDLGDDRLKAEAIPALDIVADLLKMAPESEVTVEGHTDNWPISSARFPSNWELSAARALSVVKYFAFKKGMNPARFAATGFGEYRPMAPNDSPLNRSKNRRVEIFIKTFEPQVGLYSNIRKDKR